MKQAHRSAGLPAISTRRQRARLDSDIVGRKLATHSVLSAIEIAALSALATQPAIFKTGAMVAVVGDRLDRATFMIGGLACRSKILADGRRQILSLLLPGDMVDAHASLLGHRDDNLEALTTCQVSHASQAELKAVGLTHPGLGEAMLRQALIEGAIGREWVINVGRRSTLEALAHLICEMKLRLDAVGLGVDDAYPFALTQEDMADALGVTSIHLNRVLKMLRSMGSISLQGKVLKICDWPRLLALANFSSSYLHLHRAAA